MLSVLSLALATGLAFVQATPLDTRATTCACGYKDETGAIWREGIVADFTNNYANALSYFSPQSGSAKHNGTTYTMTYTPSNVFQYNDGLGLKTSGYSGSGPIYTAELDSVRSDFQYGTFRIRATVPSVPGVCFGFFTYHQNADGSNVQETDIEFLSSDANYYNTIHYTNQPGTVNGNVDPNAYHVVSGLNTDLTAFHNHRFDWLPGKSVFYLDNAQTTTLAKNVPTVGSSILLNVWSDGGNGWTKGPPTKDAIATIYTFKAYFNSTSLSAATFNSQCVAAGRPAPCAVSA